MEVKAGPCKRYPKCSGKSLGSGCDGTGRIQGGIATVPGFGWWPIKVCISSSNAVIIVDNNSSSGSSTKSISGPVKVCSSIMIQGFVRLGDCVQLSS